MSPSTWRAEWERLTYESLPDDPVPQAVLNAMEGLDLGQLREIVASLPRRSSAGIDHRLKQARAQLNDATQEIWRAVLASTDLSLPLLIVDEAHRLKNDDTRISQLFAPRTPGHHSGALTNIFDRILLLTATPFELGHAELVRVLRRLNAVQGHTAPGLHNSLDERLDRLAEVLTNAQAAAINLDHAWSNVTAEDHHRFDEWTPGSAPAEGLSAHAATAWRAACYAATSRQQMHEALRPWVIRHERPRRRTYLPGRDILPSPPSGSGSGLDIADDVALPFLLAARAQAVAGEQAHGAARPHFAYGIASSFEAFRRLGSSDELRDSDVAADESSPTESKAGTSVSSSADWYHREIDVLLIDGGLDRHDHPKVRATVERAADLWLSGHKCLVFCWYIATGKAVELAIQARVESLIWERAAQALVLPVGDAQAELTRVSERLLRRDSRSYDETRARLEKFFAECVARADQKPQQGLVDNLVEIAIRNLRTPANLVRYAPLSVSISHDELWAGVQGSNPAGIRLLDRWERFAMRLAADGPDEQERVILSLLGEHATEGSDGVSDVDSSRGGASLSAVRRAHGGTKRDTRERLTALFNTPFAPDVLVASSVMGEGIDLHRECRHVIHHDLDLESQRSGAEDGAARPDRSLGRARRRHRGLRALPGRDARREDVQGRERPSRVVRHRDGSCGRRGRKRNGSRRDARPLGGQHRSRFDDEPPESLAGQPSTLESGRGVRRLRTRSGPVVHPLIGSIGEANCRCPQLEFVLKQTAKWGSKRVEQSSRCGLGEGHEEGLAQVPERAC